MLHRYYARLVEQESVMYSHGTVSKLWIKASNGIKGWKRRFKVEMNMQRDMKLRIGSKTEYSIFKYQTYIQSEA